MKTARLNSFPLVAVGLPALLGMLWPRYEAQAADPVVTNLPLPARMELIPAGSFEMGDTFGEGYSHERPVHAVLLSAFHVDRTEVTKAQWDEVYQWAVDHGYGFDHRGSGKAPNHPIHSVNWYDAVKWCNARSEREGRKPAYYTSTAQTAVYRSGQIDLDERFVKWDAGFRLPTEAEWEKAARGGLEGKRFPWGDTISHSQANYHSSWKNGRALQAYEASSTEGFHPAYAKGEWPFTSPVGSFAANGHGLCDMAANVTEWCWDWYLNPYYCTSPGRDPKGPSSGTARVIRGGSWDHDASYCRIAYRNFIWPDYRVSHIGFRSVLPASQPSRSPRAFSREPK